MSLSLLESLRRLVRQDLTRVAQAVGNFHGAVANTVDLLEAAPAQSWLVLLVNGARTSSLAEFFQDYDVSAADSAFVEAAAAGTMRVSLPPGKVALLRTVATTNRSQVVRLDLTMENTAGVALVYVDGVLQRTVEGTNVGVPLTMTPGTHTIAVLVQAAQVQVTLPSNLPFSGIFEQLATPQWRQITTGYLDAQNGTVANTLEWVSDAQVGGYRILRRTVQHVGDVAVAGDGEILSVGSLDDNNRFTVTLQNDQTATLSPGLPLIINTVTLGIVVRTALDDNGDTAVTCRLPATLTTPDTTAVGQYCYTGQLVELTRVLQENAAAIVRYEDAAVTYGTEYEYALQAVGMLDSNVVSAVSERVFVRAGDSAPPAAITLLSGYPTVLNRQVTVRFTTPADGDYQGVRVYQRTLVTNNGTPFTAASVVGLTVTIQGAVALPLSLAGYLVKFGSSPVFAVNQRTGNFTFTLFQDPGVITAGTTLTLYKDTLVKTDYGSPSREDEVTFDATTYGDYYFSTFDRSNNEQSPTEAVIWTYTTSDDRFSGPPVLALRQLSKTEQANFASYTDVQQYAIIEIFAYDPNQVVANKFTGVTLYYERVGQDVVPATTTPAPVTLTPVPDQGVAFATVVSSATTVDNVSGTRKRYVAVSRDFPTVRVWAKNNLELTSDITTFVADHDTTPAITSLETTIVNATNAIQFTAVVDDDTACVEWKIDDQGPYLVDTSSLKRFSMPGDVVYPSNTPILVDLGQRRELRMTPYKVNVTGFTQPQKDAVAGELVVRELVRTPRSSVALEDKDAAGARSAEWVTATFTQSPAGVAQVLTGSSTAARSGTVALNSSRYRITDAGVSWTAGQWQSTTTKHFYALVNASGYASVLRRIVDSGTTTLDLEGSMPFTGAVTYQILDGAVLVRTGSEAFLPTTGIDVRSRTATFTYEFYGTKNGCYAENVRSVRVDADTLPSLDGFAYDYNSGTSQLTVRFDTADDDATTWEVYERKGGWPNSTSSSPGTAPTTVGELLPQYLRFSGGVERKSYSRSLAGNTSGTWYAVAVPKNSFGEPGTLSTASVNLGSPPVTPRLTGVTFAPSTPTSSDIRINFTTSNASNGDGVTLVCVRLDNPATQQTLTPTVTSNAGSADLAIGETIVPQGTSGAVSRTWQVTATLNGQNTIVGSVQVWVSGGTGTVALVSVSNSIDSQGTCGINCGSAESTPHSRLITWSATVNSVAMTAVTGASFYVDIEVATDAGGTTWNPLVSGVPAFPASYLDQSQCLYAPGSSPQYTAYWKYRVTLMDVSGVVAGPVAALTQLSAGVSWCSGNQF